MLDHTNIHKWQGLDDISRVLLLDEDHTKSFPGKDEPAGVNREGMMVALQIRLDCPEVHRLEWEKQDLEMVAMVRKRNPNQEKLVLLGKQQMNLIFQYPVTRIMQYCLELGE